MQALIQYVLCFVILIVLAIPLGKYIGNVMNGEKVFLSRLLVPCEGFIYRTMRIDKNEQMTWKKYAVSVLLFSFIGFVFVFLLSLLQGVNPNGAEGMSWDLSFNTATSFVTNTNWQAYGGEAQASYVLQFLGLTVQNFVSAATGISVLFVLIRGFVRVKTDGLGNFWVDITRVILYVLIPLSFVITLGLVSQGVVQNLKPAETVQLVEPIAVDAEGNLLEGAVIEGDTVLMDGEQVEGATVVTEQYVPMGPAASQISIKQLGTNGGGYTSANSAHPLENPTPFSNLLEMLSILLIPAALCFAFGRNVGDRRQGRAIFLAMAVLLVVALGVSAASEHAGTPQLAQNGAVDLTTVDQAGGNMEGKEARFGIAGSVNWAVYTTAASNGSVNSMHDSYTPIGGMIPMLLMQLGEVVFGGVGCGLYGMLAFAILAVFIAGLMVGRTPEYLGKKIEPYEMKMAVIACLATPVAILIGSGIATAVPGVAQGLGNSGAHGFSEVLYTFSSVGGNNGSAFAGLSATTPFFNVILGLIMLFVRFVPMMAVLAISGNLARKKKIAATAGTLSTSNALFIFLLIFVVLLIGALSLFPALSLGPIAEQVTMVG